MTSGLAVLASVLLSVLGAADGRPQQHGDLAAHVRRLVAELDAPELARRQAAEAELVSLGPRALDYLPREAAPGTAEAAQRLARIRRKLEQAQTSLGLQASQVSLNGKMPLSRILESLEKQSGNAFATPRLPGGPEALRREFELDLPPTPFWPALDAILGKAGLEVYPFGEQGRIELRVRGSPADGSGRHVAYAGPLRVELVGLEAQRDFRSGAGALKLEIEAAWEPRLAPISLKQRMKDVEGLDDRGRRLAPDAPEAELEIPVPRGPIASRFTLPLALPPRDARALRELRGALGVLAPGPAETFRFAELSGAKPVAQRVGGVAVALEGAAKLGKTLEVRLAVRFDEAHDALASHRTWIFDNPAHLESRDHKRIAPESTCPTRHTAREVGLALFFPIDGGLDEYTLVYRTPTSILAATVEYRFRDVPLP